MKDLAGRPLKFKTPKELEKKILKFFELCARTREVPLVEGLAVYLGVSVQTIINYEGKPSFGPVIKKAKLLIANGVMQRGIQGKAPPMLVAFIAKNHYGYKDDSALKLSGDPDSPLHHKVDHKFKNPLDVSLTPSQAYQKMLNGDKP